MEFFMQLFPGIGTFFAVEPVIAVARIVLIVFGFVLACLGFKRTLEPLIMVPMGIGMMAVNCGMMFLTSGTVGNLLLDPLVSDASAIVDAMQVNFLQPIYNLTFSNGLIACLVFMGIGARSEISFLLAKPWSSMIIAIFAEMGTFAALAAGVLAFGLTPEQSAAMATIGGADGPTAILTASKLSVELLPAIAIAAYSYMALIPLIQPPLMRLMTTRKMRQVKMSQLRVVSKTEKIIFPIAVTIFVVLLIPDTAPLIGMLMLGNLFRECGVTERLSDTAQNALINIVTIPLGLSVGFKATADQFLTPQTLGIVALGLTAFLLSTAGGLLLGDLMYVLTGGKVNPLIGSAGVSAVPMAARVSQVEGQKENPSNFLLMHAMGPNVAGVIGSACAAGFMIKVFGG